MIRRPRSGYLQFVRPRLVDLAVQYDAVIKLHHRPGHFVVAGHPFVTVWPAAAAPEVERLAARHITGPHRTLNQDVAFAVDQLVEIAIRALSPAVNDTFTALTCIDWLTDSLARCTCAGTRCGSTATTSATCGWSPRTSATAGWSSGPTRRSARPGGGCPR